MTRPPTVRGLGDNVEYRYGKPIRYKCAKCRRGWAVYPGRFPHGWQKIEIKGKTTYLCPDCIRKAEP